MFFRRMVRLALAALLLGGGAAWVRAHPADPAPDGHPPTAAQQQPTGILRLLSATQPIADQQLSAGPAASPLLGDPNAADPGALDPDAPRPQAGQPCGPLEWHNPY